jgi:hypothetical protein
MENLYFLTQRQYRKKDIAMFFIFILLLLAGLLTFNEYGKSWDEEVMQIYADQSLHSYSTWYERGRVSFEHDILKYYGPFLVMMVEIAVKYLGWIFEEVEPFDIRHFVYFLTYFAGTLAFYSIARRWFEQISAMGATLLFALQPVFWGHAFINPKDTPFLSLILLSIAAGLKMVDAVRNINDVNASFFLKLPVLFASFVWIISIFLLFAGTELVHDVITSLVVSAKSGEINIVTFIASKLEQTTAKVYIQRYFVLYLRFCAVYFVLSTAILLRVWQRFHPVSLKILAVVVLPAALLGFATSIRALAPFAGVIILYYLIRTKTKMAFPAAVMYVVVAMIAAYMTWPFLWLNPLGNLLESLVTMSAHPWQGSVLFNGEMYPASNLPLSYLPTLLFIQLTEPVWLLAAVGLGISFFSVQKRTELITLFAFWFLLPISALMFRDTVLYDNFRQVLFVLPPVFLLAGAVFEKVAKPGWRIALITACLLPGIAGIISLHPYQYVYYNGYIGGMNGANGRFEMDYWLTSYREAAEYVNQNASPDAAIWVQGPGHLFTPYARPDLVINSWSKAEPVDGYEFAVVSYRFDEGETSYPDAEIIHRIMRGDAILTVIKKP